jgi:DNA-directed RNA polymerase specialized sigma24 family protein
LSARNWRVHERGGRHRLGLLCVHGYGWTLREVADVCGLRITTVQNHLERGPTRLRSLLEVSEDA